jgi:hypothetical protein
VIKFRGIDEDGFYRAVIGHTMYRCHHGRGIVDKLVAVRGGPSVWKRTRGKTAEELLLATYIDAQLLTGAQT